MAVRICFFFFILKISYLRINSDDNAIARQLFEEAIALDPEFSIAYVDLAATHIQDIHYGVSKSPKESLGRAAQLVQRAISLDESLPLAHSLVGLILMYKRKFEDAIAQGEKAVTLSPNDSLVRAILAHNLAYAGRYEDALEVFKKVIPLNPNDITVRIRLAVVFSLLGREEDASAEAAEVLRLNPKFSIKNISKWPYKNKADIDFMMTALRKAGLPE